MPEALENNGQMLLMLGELRGQMKELIHSVNNSAQLVNGLTDKVNAAQGLPDMIKSVAVDVAAHEVRLTALEATENRRMGAFGLGGWLLKAVPYVASVGAGGILVKLIGG